MKKLTTTGIARALAAAVEAGHLGAEQVADISAIISDASDGLDMDDDDLDGTRSQILFDLASAFAEADPRGCVVGPHGTVVQLQARACTCCGEVVGSDGRCPDAACGGSK